MARALLGVAAALVALVVDDVHATTPGVAARKVRHPSLTEAGRARTRALHSRKHRDLSPKKEKMMKFEESYYAVSAQVYPGQTASHHHPSSQDAGSNSSQHRGLQWENIPLGGQVPGHRPGSWGGDWNPQSYMGEPGGFEPLRVTYNTDTLFPCTAIDKQSTADVAVCYSGMAYAADTCTPPDVVCTQPAVGEDVCPDQPDVCFFTAPGGGSEAGTCGPRSVEECAAALSADHLASPTIVDDGSGAQACAALGCVFTGADWAAECSGLGGGGVCQYSERPDGELACYAPGDVVKVGEIDDDQDHPSTGSYTQCDYPANENAENCWMVCREQEIMKAEDYVTSRDILDAGAAEILASLQVERPAGPLVLADYDCDSGLSRVPSIPDTDLFVWVYSRPYGSASGIAFASVCQRDQNGRPISAVMGMQAKLGGGPHMEPFADSTVTTIVHELYHAMGFSGGAWNEDENMMLDENLNPRGTLVEQEFPYAAYSVGDIACTAPAGEDDEAKQACADAIELIGDWVFEDLKADCESASHPWTGAPYGCTFTGGSAASISCEACIAGGISCPACKTGEPSPKYSTTGLTSPRALQNVRKFFGCPTLESMTIEDEGSASSRGSHWEFIHFAQSAVNSIGGTQGFGAFTAATYGVFEDLGWYTATLAEATFPTFGFDQGCDFAASRSCGALEQVAGEPVWQSGSGPSSGYSLPAAVTYADGSVAREWPAWDGSAVVEVNTGADNRAADLACDDVECSNTDFDHDLDDTPGYVCSFDRAGVGQNLMTYKPVAAKCDGSATDPADFDPNCEYPSWRVHFADGGAAVDGTVDPSVFPYWENNYGTTKFDNACPIIQSETNCISGDLDSYFSVRYSNDEEGSWHVRRGIALGETSRCFESSLYKPDERYMNPYGFDVTSGRRDGHCYTTECDYDNTQLTVILSDDTRIACPVDGGKAHATGYAGLILCPSFDELCGLDRRALEFKEELADGSALRFKGLNPSFGAKAGGSEVTIYGRGFSDGLSVSFGGLDATVVSVSETAASIITPASTDDGAVDVVLSLNGAQDVGYSSFEYGEDNPVHLRDTAVSLVAGAEPVFGGTADLENSVTWHQVFFSVDSVVDTVYFSVFMFYGATDSRGAECHGPEGQIDTVCMGAQLDGTSHEENKAQCLAVDPACVFGDGHEFSVHVEEVDSCSAAADASEMEKYQCAILDESGCEQREGCRFSIAQKFVLSLPDVVSTPDAAEDYGGAFQLLVRQGELPTRRHNDATLPDLVEVATDGVIEYYLTDCEGTAGGDAVVDECGVCGGNNFWSDAGIWEGVPECQHSVCTTTDYIPQVTDDTCYEWMELRSFTCATTNFEAWEYYSMPDADRNGEADAPYMQGRCNLYCGFDAYSGDCTPLLSSNTCMDDFNTGGRNAGLCDFTCGFCATERSCTIPGDGVPVVTDGTVATYCAAGAEFVHGGSTCDVTCDAGFAAEGLQASCDDGTFVAGSVMCQPEAPCDTADCGIGASCSDDGTSYTCTCDGGYSGSSTTNTAATCTDTDGCSGVDCGTGATCTDIGAPGIGYMCTCDTGYTGGDTFDAAAVCTADANPPPPDTDDTCVAMTAPAITALGYAVAGTSTGTTVTALGAVTCAPGYTATVAGTAPSVSCSGTAVNGYPSEFTFTGCIDGSGSPPSPPSPCPSEWIGDGDCDDVCDNEAHGYDYPDCEPAYDEVGENVPVATADCDTGPIVAHVDGLLQFQQYSRLDDENYAACMSLARYAKSVGQRLIIKGSCGAEIECDFVDLVLWLDGAHAGSNGETVWPTLPDGADAAAVGLQNARRCPDAQAAINSHQCPSSDNP
jgi:hypothetical protein